MLSPSWLRSLAWQWPSVCLLGIMLSVTGFGSASAQQFDTSLSRSDPGSHELPSQPQLYYDGSDPSISAQDAAIAFALAQGIQDPESIVEFVNTVLQVEPPVGLEQVQGRDTDLYAVSDFDCDGQAATVVDAAILYGMTAGMGTWAEVEEYLSQELQIPMTLGEGCAWPGGDPVEIPQSAVVIRDVEQIDGTPLTLGDTITLEALAGDEQGQDISDQIQWFNSQGELLGIGPSLAYQAQQVQMETLTAQIIPTGTEQADQLSLMAGGSAQEDRVSFTISSEDVVVAPHVKVLSDETASLIQNFDPRTGRLEMVEDALLPVIRIGDVVIGAAGVVPPLKVVSLDRQEGVLILGTEPALPKEVIESGTATFEQTIDWSGSSGEVTIVDVPGEPYDIAEDLEPKWDGFVQEGEPIERSLRVTGSVGLEWIPTYVGSISFDATSEEGISHFSLSHTGEISSSTKLDAYGFYDWRSNNKYFVYPLSRIQKNSEITVQVGPIPWVVELELSGGLGIASSVAIEGQAHLGRSYEGASLTETISYDPSQESEEWSYQASMTEGTWSSISDENTEMTGLVGFDFHPQVKITLFGQRSSQSGIRFNIGSVGVPTSLLYTPTKTSQDEGVELQVNLSGDRVIVSGGFVSYISGLRDQNNSVSTLPLEDFVSYADTSIELPFPTELIALLIALGSVIVGGLQELGDITLDVVTEINDATIEQIREQLEASIYLQVDCSQIPAEECLGPTPVPSPIIPPLPDPEPSLTPFPNPTTTPKDCDPLVFTAWAAQYAESRPNAVLPWEKYEQRICGIIEYKIPVPDTYSPVTGRTLESWADGIDPDNCCLLECKYAGCNLQSLYVTQLNAHLNVGVEEQFRKYGGVINDPLTPAVCLKVYVSLDEMRPIFEGLMSTYQIPGSIETRIMNSH